MATFRRRIASKVFAPDGLARATRLWRAARRRSPWDPSPIARGTRSYVRERGLTVAAGPFQGLVFPRQAVGHGLLVPKLVGTYEQELHGCIDAAVRRGPRLIVDVGAAEGYYAVGLARRLPDVRVVAADIDPVARRLCGQVAGHNGVRDQVEIVGEMDDDSLAELLGGQPSLLFLDCEGAESQLVTERTSRHLAGTEIIVEVHDFIVPRTTESLERALAATHEVRRIEVAPRSPPAGLRSLLGPDLATRLVQEGRPPAGMRWLHARPACPGYRPSR